MDAAGVGVFLTVLRCLLTFNNKLKVHLLS